ncbi:glycosyltransferase family 1 protein [Peribacillus frigoritolerans]|uniref:glycosyltransferase family 1 protein n=1 Tax=Peribacillus frigoritolerans TaxID=450367 RepID=UPI0039A0894D
MKEPIRVLHVIGAMNHGGAETIIMNLYREVDRSKIQFDFAVHTLEKSAFDDEITSLGGVIYRIPKFNGKNPIQYFRAWSRFWTNNKNHRIVHGHIGGGAAIYLYVAKKFGIYTIAHSHSAGTIHNFHDIIWKIFSFPTRYVAECFFACSNLAGVKRFGKKFNNKKTTKYILPNAIKSEKYVFSNKIRHKLRNKHNLEDYLVYGHVGRFTHAKNHMFLIDIFYQLHKINPSSKLILVGDGELRGKIENKVNELGLNNEVIITGFVDNVHDYLQAFDFFIFPSIYEGLPTSVIEAQASGLPCFVSNTITSEVVISKKVKQLSIKIGPQIWVETIRNYNLGTRGNMQGTIEKAGYDVKAIAKWLENFYVSKV